MRRRYEQYGIAGIIHKGRGKPSNRKMSVEKTDQIIKKLREQYVDFGATFASEMLLERDGIQIGKESVRQLQIQENLHIPRKKKDSAVYRSWRMPRKAKGMLIQFDGSYEYWFELRGIRCCLLAAIDDASGEIQMLQFVEGNESIANVFAFWKEYVLTIGKPESIYVDRFSTYKQNQITTQEGTKTQFQRVMEVLLKIEVIFAHSPQAKGRIERLFSTLQDRLIKLFRLEEIDDIVQANRYVQEIFIPSFNKQFGRVAVENTNNHHPLTSYESSSIDAIFSIQYTRVMANDYTILFKYQTYQLDKKQPVYLKPGERIHVYETDRKVILLKSPKNEMKYLGYVKIPKRIKKEKEIKEKKKQIPIPAKSDHPWKHSDPFLYHKRDTSI